MFFPPPRRRFAKFLLVERLMGARRPPRSHPNTPLAWRFTFLTSCSRCLVEKSIPDFLIFLQAFSFLLKMLGPLRLPLIKRKKCILIHIQPSPINLDFMRKLDTIVRRGMMINETNSICICRNSIYVDPWYDHTLSTFHSKLFGRATPRLMRKCFSISSLT